MAHARHPGPEGCQSAAHDSVTVCLLTVCLKAPIHPLSIPLNRQGRGEAEANPNWIWLRDGGTPWAGHQSIAGLTQGRVTIHVYVFGQFRVAT